jgi:hypothetical protein
MNTMTSELQEQSSVSEMAQSIQIFKSSEINITKPDIVRQLISHIERNILGKLPEFIRYFMHYELIFNIITERDIVLGPTCITAIKVEIDQIRSVFNRDPSKLEKIILSNDKKQFDKFSSSIKSRKHRIEHLKGSLERLLFDLKKTFITAVEHSIPSYEVKFITQKYIYTMKKLNKCINDIRINDQFIPWIIEPNENTKQPKHKSFMCAASVFEISSDEFKDLVEESTMIAVHKSTRRYKCLVNSSALDTYITKCLENAFPKIESPSSITLKAHCPCTKICGSKCASIVSIDDLVHENNLDSKFKLRIDNKKKNLFKSIYGVEIFTKCPKPNCPNGDGFPITEILTDILNGSIDIYTSPIHKCNLCDSVWCSKCGKVHPGRLCADEENNDDVELGTDVKKCPNCKLPTIRDEGCFHMNCLKCNVHWCWDCNHFTPQSNAYAHNCIKGNWIVNTNTSDDEADDHVESNIETDDQVEYNIETDDQVESIDEADDQVESNIETDDQVESNIETDDQVESNIETDDQVYDQHQYQCTLI